MKYNQNFILQRNLKNLFDVNGTLEDEQMFELISRVKSDAHAAQSQLCVITKSLVEADLMKQNISSSVKSLIEIATAPDATQPQLSEIRYVLHGDIQPCSVLYSDDTTTLLRLDEGDIMCETDTIEWSDSVTYRCQELLRGAAKRSGHHMTNMSGIKAMAQLVRDERILLNDNGDDECADADERIGGPVAVVPAPPPFGHEKPDHNNPYVHTNNMLTEEAMRKSGWTSESLVSCGHGHYAPVQHPADFNAVADEDAGHVNPCEDCGHVFDKDAMTCTMCNTIRTPKLER